GVAIVATALVVTVVVVLVIVIRAIAMPAGLTMVTATFAGCAVGFVLGLLICALGSCWCFAEPESARQSGGLVAIAGAIAAGGSGVAAALVSRPRSE
ncbi:MAG: hypothetical protein ACE5JM_16135, partial [Armatimonadota bacterium]